MKILKFLKNFVVQTSGGNVFKTNNHLLLLDANNSRVTLEVVHKARNVILDLIIYHLTWAMPYNQLM